MDDLGPQVWKHQALCAQVDAELWFPEPHVNPTEAVRICSRCPVVADCLAFALDRRIMYGVFGGTTPRQRKLLLKERDAA